MDDDVLAELEEIIGVEEELIADEISEAFSEVIHQLIERYDEAGQLTRSLLSDELRRRGVLQ